MIISYPEIMKRPLKGVQHIVLGCDGIFDLYSNQDIYDMILEKEKAGLKIAAEDIL